MKPNLLLKYILLLAIKIIYYAATSSPKSSPPTIETSNHPSFVNNVTSSLNCYPNTVKSAPPIYWINLNKSVDRREYFTKELERMHIRRHERVPALDLQSSLSISIHMTSLTRANSHIEYVVMASHLRAMRTAIKLAKRLKSHYAIICEDDIRFLHDIDYNKLIQTAPKGFGILQLVTSNYDHLDRLWSDYRQNSSITWTRRLKDCWSTQIYLVDTQVIKKYVNYVYRENNTDYTINIHPFGLLKPKCKSASIQIADNTVFSDSNICQFPDELFVETFVFEGVPSYVSNIPLFTSADVGYNSTVHQDHVETYHRRSFEFINSVFSGFTSKKIQLPDYVLPPVC